MGESVYLVPLFAEKRQLAGGGSLTPFSKEKKKQKLASKEKKKQKLASEEEKKQKPAVGERDRRQKQVFGYFIGGGEYDPNFDFANDPDPDWLPEGPSPEHRPQFNPIWSSYELQIRRSNGFDIDDFPGSTMLAGVGPVRYFSDKAERLKELAERAIQEYNEKAGNVFKYTFLKIEKVTAYMTSYFEYLMTVKVKNLTLGTAIETFQIHAATRFYNNDEKVIRGCRPKEEVHTDKAIDGLPS